TDLPELVRLRGLTRGALHAQRKLLFAELQQLLTEIRSGLAAQFFGVHQRTCRFTNDVETDNLDPARRNASRAVVSSTPSISKSTLPGRTRANQYSTLPLPLPMRPSSGFLLIGTSGNTRIQICPPRFTYRAMARRAASISRAVMRARLVAFKPNSPKETLLPRCARPAIRPLNILRYLVRLGCIITAYPQLNPLPLQPEQPVAHLGLPPPEPPRPRPAPVRSEPCRTPRP